MGRSTGATNAPQTFGNPQQPNVVTPSQTVPTLANPGLPAYSGFGFNHAANPEDQNVQNMQNGTGAAGDFQDMRQRFLEQRQHPFFGEYY